MKKPLLILTICLFSLSLLSQSCLPEGITFNTQAQLDSFQILYPNCTEIEGDVTIAGGDIMNINELSSITSIGGSLNIAWGWGSTILPNLVGLDNLASIGNDLTIMGYTSLINLEGLGSLISVGGKLMIYSNSLDNLEGMNSLETVTGNFIIIDEVQLNNLSGLESLITVGGDVDIGNQFNPNPSLTNLSGLNSLTTIGNRFLITFNQSLTNLSGLSSLTSIGGDFIIDVNDALTSLSGMETLTSINGEIWIAHNDALTDLTGIENIEGNSIQELVIIYNTSLMNCAIQSICDYIASPDATVSVHSNASGCNSFEEVEEGCETVSINEFSPIGNISTSPNPFTVSTTIEYELKQSEKVTLAIYDYLGKQVFHTQESQPQGSQQLLWNAEGIADGIYYYRLQVGDAVSNGKLVKVR